MKIGTQYLEKLLSAFVGEPLEEPEFRLRDPKSSFPPNSTNAKEWGFIKPNGSRLIGAPKQSHESLAKSIGFGDGLYGALSQGWVRYAIGVDLSLSLTLNNTARSKALAISFLSKNTTLEPVEIGLGEHDLVFDNSFQALARLRAASPK